MSNSQPEFDSRKSQPSFELIPAPAPVVPSLSGDWAQPGFTENTAEGAGLSRYLHALRRRWLVALVIALPLSAIAGSAAWFFLPRKYTAIALLRLAPSESKMIFETADNINFQASNAFDIYKKTQRQLLLSRFVLMAALRDLDPTKFQVLRDEADPVDWLEANINVVFPDEAEVMHVSLTADQPDGLQQLVKAVVDGYFDEFVHVDRKRKIDRLEKLKQAHAKADIELRAKRSDLKELVERVGSGEPSTLNLQQQNVVRQYSSIELLLAKTRADLAQALGELELHEEALATKDLAAKEGDNEQAPGEDPGEEIDDVAISEHEVMLALKSDKAFEQLKADRQKILDLIASTNGRVKEGVAHAKIIEELQHRLETHDKKLAARRQDVRDELIEQKRLTAAAGINALKRKTNLLIAQEKRLSAKAHELEGDAQKFGRSSVDVELLRGEIAAKQELSSRLGSEVQRTSVELEAEPKNSSSRVMRLGDALPARATDLKTRLPKILGIAVAGLLLPIGLIVWLDSQKERINSGTEVTQGLGLVVLGAVPRVPERIMRRLDGSSPKERYWRTLLSESVDSVAAVLLRGAKAEGIRVVMVSSATAGEGKTTLAANLATSLAGAGRRTVLVDFDLRRPALHRVFGLPLSPGINDVLREPQAFDSAIQTTEISNLAFLPAGTWNAAGLGKLAFADLKSLFAHLRDSFEFVVVDGSPVLPVVDTRLIAQHVDTVVLSVLRDVSCIPQVRAAGDLLTTFAIPIFGVVVTGSRNDAYPHSTYEPYLEAKAV